MTVRSTTITEAGRSIRGRIVGAVVVFVGLVALVVIGSATDRSTVIDGPNGSSFVTTPNGTAALFELLDRTDRAPLRLTSTIDDRALDGLTTLIVVEPGLTAYEPSEVRAIAGWVDAGGRLIVAGRPPPILLDALEIEIEWSLDDLGVAATIIPAERAVDGSRFGSWPNPAANLPWAATDEGAAIVVTASGQGFVGLIADLGIVTNEGLPRADNAAMSLALVGSGPVGFDEVRHGYTDTDAPSLIDAAPGNWSTTLPLLAVALAAGLIAYGRRLGPPEPSARAMIPGREAFIGSMGDLLRRSGDARAISDPIRHSARRLLAARSGFGDPDSMRHAAASAGLTDQEYSAVFSDTPDSAFDADRALAKLSSPRRGGNQ